jgi:hypothetical protein
VLGLLAGGPSTIPELARRTGASHHTVAGACRALVFAERVMMCEMPEHLRSRQISKAYRLA